ncbi:hypothetical protein SUDANB5_02538 [Streptomyces sp. SudanB5_2050]
MGSVTPEGRVDLHVAVTATIQLCYLLLTMPLSLGRLLLARELLRLDASHVTLRKDRGNQRARDTNHGSG